VSEKPKKKKRSSVGRVFAVIGKIIGTILLVGVLTVLIFSCIFVKYVRDDLEPQADFSIEKFSPDQTSTIYYTDPTSGQNVALQQLYGSENRTWVAYKDIPKNLKFACIAIEDKRFLEHQGVDWLRTLKATFNMVAGGDSTYGASTITQQLIKNLTNDKEVTVRRKLLEIVRALAFEKKHSKDEILEWYLNTIYLGEGCYGVQSASQVYFGKDVSELSLAECASLIGITNNPSIYDPYINPEKNKTRELTILGAMLDQGYILDQKEYSEAVAQKLVFVNNSGKKSASADSGYYSYFVDQVIRDVISDLCAKTGYSETFVGQMVRSGGYSIYCTLDPNVQAAVDEVYQDLSNIPKTKSTQQLQSGMVIIDNETGNVVAMAGGVGKKEGSLTLNRATQSYLSPGSTIKPITVYGPALDKGIVTPATVYDDTPYQFSEKSGWPKNTDSTYRGLVSVNTAVSLSINTVAVKVAADLTPQYCYDFAKNKMGLSTLVDNEIIGDQTYSDIDLAPMALGGLTKGVTVEDMAAAYAVFADKGTYRKPRTYTKVVDSSGKTVLDNTQTTVNAMSEKAAWYMTYMLENAVESGTGTAAQIEGMAVAGKTGTTTSDKDRWFCGYTPYYTGAVWCGYDDPEEVVLTDSDTNPSAYLWQKVMASVHKNLKSETFWKPTDIVECSYCRDSGLLATSACQEDPRGSQIVTGYLALEDVPQNYCNVHATAEICDASGHIANEYCRQVKDNKTHEVGLLMLDRAFPIPGIVVRDQQYVIASLSKIPSGYYPAQSPVADPIGTPCTLHTQADLETETTETASDTATDTSTDTGTDTGTDTNTDTNTETQPGETSAETVPPGDVPID